MCKIAIRIFSIYSPFPLSGDCLACLSAAAQDVASGCRGNHRAAAWRAVCLLSYADTNTSSPREDTFRDWFYVDGGGDGPTAALGANARATARRWSAPGKSTTRRSWCRCWCWCRAPALQSPQARRGSGRLRLLEVVFVEVYGLLFCIKKIGEMNPE
jgi:hypothetical protein